METSRPLPRGSGRDVAFDGDVRLRGAMREHRSRRAHASRTPRRPPHQHDSLRVGAPTERDACEANAGAERVAARIDAAPFDARRTWLQRASPRARRAREFSAEHFPLLVLLPVLFTLSLVAEVLALGARPGRLWALWLALWIAAWLLRYAAVRALGDRWTVRICAIPGLPRVRSGPYRFLRHPNSVAVVLELLDAPLLFGAWRTALAIGTLNLIALAIRIHAEEGALRGAMAFACPEPRPSEADSASTSPIPPSRRRLSELEWPSRSS